MSTVQHWGNSLAVRIPKEVIEIAKIARGDKVKFKICKGAIMMIPEKPKNISLKEMLSKIDANNCHSETPWGATVGNEVLDD